MIMKAVLEMDTAHPYSIGIGMSGPFSQNCIVMVVGVAIVVVVVEVVMVAAGRNSLVNGLAIPPMR